MLHRLFSRVEHILSPLSWLTVSQAKLEILRAGLRVSCLHGGCVLRSGVLLGRPSGGFSAWLELSVAPVPLALQTLVRALGSPAVVCTRGS